MRALLYISVTTQPSLTETMYDARQVFTKHFPQLSLDLLLQILLYDSDAVEGAAYVDALERVILEDKSDAFLFGHNKHDYCLEPHR